MATVIDILEALESDNSRLFKEDLLEKNRANALLKRVFTTIGDPYINFFVNKFKMPKAGSTAAHSDDHAVESFLDLLVDDLSTRTIVGNAAKDAVQNFFSHLTERQQKWCLRILLKNLRCGVQTATVNKTWPGSIVGFSVQLAETLKTRYESGALVISDRLEFPVRVEPKLDGLRCVAVKHSGTVTMFTRSGSVIETLPRIKGLLESAPWDGFVLDAEVMGRDWNESASVVMSHKTGKDDAGMVLHVFDAMAFEDWRDQDNALTLADRVELVSELVAQVGSPSVVSVAGITADTIGELLTYYSKCTEDGYEGVMVKDLDSPYIFKRSDSVRKMKPVATYEGVVVGHYEGNRGSKREGLWGGFEVVLPNGVVTKLGGGFTDKMKAEISINPDAWIGRVVEMEGQPDPLTRDGLTRDGKVRFPVFIRERDPSDVDQKVVDAGDAYIGRKQ